MIVVDRTDTVPVGSKVDRGVRLGVELCTKLSGKGCWRDGETF